MGRAKVFETAPMTEQEDPPRTHSPGAPQHGAGIPGFGTWEWDVATNELMWSDDLKRLYGVDRTPAGPFEFLEMIHPDDRVRVDAETSSYMEAGGTFDHEFRIVRPDGEVRTVLDRGVIHRAPDGRPQRLVGVNIDITAVRADATRSEHAVRARSVAALLQTLSPNDPGLAAVLDFLPAGIMLAEPSGMATFQNAALQTFWRGEHALRSFDDWSDYIAWRSGSQEPMRAHDWPLAKALATGEAQDAVEIRFQRFDGSIGFMLVSAVPVRNAAGEVVSGVAVAHDITALKEAEGEARLGRELLHRIGESTPDLIYAKDHQGRMTFANPATLKTVGKSWADIAGRTDLEWHGHEGEARAIMQADRQVMESGKAVRIEEAFTGPDGHEVFLSTKNPLFDDAGAVIGLIGISTNITPLKQAESQTRMLMQELNHRVKNVLSLVQSMARQTLRASGLEPTAWERFESRLIALSHSQDILVSESWTGADIARIVADALRAVVPSGRVHVDGPYAWLDARAAMGLALSLHELGTNAVKYGALSAAGGQVRVSWAQAYAQDEDTVAFTWVETGGPAVRPPERRGFGSRLIETAFAFQGPGRVQLDYRPEGLVMRARITLAHPKPPLTGS